MRAEHAPGDIDDLARLGGAGAQLGDECRVIAGRHEADVLAVGLRRHRQIEAPRQRARLVLGHAAQREAQEGELRARRREEEIALVATLVRGAVQLRPAGAVDAAHVMPGGERVGAEIARGRQQVAELDRLIAAHAGDRRLAARVGVGEVVDHVAAEAALVVEHVMRYAQPLGDARGVVDVPAGAACALLRQGRAMVVELQRDADHVAPLLHQQRRRHRAVDAAGHGDDDAALARGLVEAKGVHPRLTRSSCCASPAAA